MSTEGDVAQAIATPLVAALATIVARAISGGMTAEEAAADTVAAVILSIPREQLRAYLSEGGVFVAEVSADIAEDIKFGNDG